MSSRFASWMRFNTVGVFGMAVQLIILTILRSGAGLTVRLSTVLAVECAVIHNFIWHERWTWAHRGLDMRGIPRRLFRFNAANGLISILGNLAVMEILAVRLHFPYLLANVVAIGMCAVLNFLASDKLVFR